MRIRQLCVKHKTPLRAAREKQQRIFGVHAKFLSSKFKLRFCYRSRALTTASASRAASSATSLPVGLTVGRAEVGRKYNRRSTWTANLGQLWDGVKARWATHECFAPRVLRTPGISWTDPTLREGLSCSKRGFPSAKGVEHAAISQKHPGRDSHLGNCS